MVFIGSKKHDPKEGKAVTWRPPEMVCGRLGPRKEVAGNGVVVDVHTAGPVPQY